MSCDTCTTPYQCTGYGCTCYNTCYRQTCSCNAVCYTQGCTCNTGYGSSCGCNALCYSEDATRPAPLISMGGSEYTGEQQVLATAWTDYEKVWGQNPATSADWTAAAASAVTGFGYKAVAASAGVYADISQEFLSVIWTLPRPVIGLQLYKNGVLTESVQRPIQLIGETTDQTVKLATILKLDPGDTIQITATKTLNDDLLIGDTKYSFLAIHRLGGQGL